MLVIAGVLAVLAAGFAVYLLGGSGNGTPTAGPTPDGTPTFTLPSTSASAPDTSSAEAPSADLIAAGALRCPTGGVIVSTSGGLTSALAGARPGSVIRLLPGTYHGNFVAKVAGTAVRPVFVCGPSTAVLDGGDTNNGYGLYLNRASYWRIVGLTVQDSQKGVVLDGVTHAVLQGLTVQNVGDEGIHLRRASTYNVVVGNIVRYTGLHKAKFGEGIYIGTAVKNWCTYSNCVADRSDHNVIAYNTVSATGAESVDVKEGTTGGVIRNNHFSSGPMTTGATSWVNVKGNNYLVSANVGVDGPLNGFSTHVIVDGWGQNNTFVGNVARVNSSGYGFDITGHVPNRVACNNVVSAAGAGFSNVGCS